MVTMENFNLYIMLCAFYVMLFTTIKNKMNWTSLVVQWLRLHASNAGGRGGSIPGWGTKILRAA